MTSTRRVDGPRLRHLREDLGLSLRGLAAKTLGKCSPTYLSLIENGKVAPSNVMVGRIAVGLGVSPDEFSTREPIDRAA